MGHDDDRPDELTTKVFGERTLYESPWVRLTMVDIEPPDGHRFEHHVVRLNRVAIAVVLKDADEVLMLWRHRFVDDSWGWELPGGIVEDGEEPAVCAAREVEEETGWRPGRLEPLVAYQPMPGMVDTPHYLFVSDDAEHIGDPSDAEEAGRVGWVPLRTVVDLIARREVLGAGSLVGLLYVLASRGRTEGR